MGAFRSTAQVVGADPPPVTCIRTLPHGGYDSSQQQCPVDFSYLLSGNDLVTGDNRNLAFREGTVRLNDYQSQGPEFMSDRSDMTLRLVSPRDPVEFPQPAVNVSRITALWSPDNALSTREIADLRARLTGNAVGPEEVQLGWTHPDIPPKKPSAEIEWLVNAIEDDPTRVCLSLSKIDLKQELNISMYIAKEYRPTTCPYESLFRHERKHSDGYTSATDKYLDASRKALLELRAIPWKPQPLVVSSGAIDQEQSRIVKVIHDTIWPHFLELLAIFQKQRDEIDTPEEYSQVRSECPDYDWY